jgi:hypothetical protein
MRVNTARQLTQDFGGAGDLDGSARALLGRPLPGSERDRLVSSGAGKGDLAHALLSLPEAHLA